MSDLPSLATVLRRAGWLPEAAPDMVAQGRDPNLLLPLAAAWQRGAAEGVRSLPPWRRSLSQAPLDRPPPALTWGWPLASRVAVQRWLGDRLVWWPFGIPPGPLVGLASSRIGRQLDERADWFAALRAACAHCQQLRGTLFSAASTTTGRFLSRAACHFDLRGLLLHAPPAAAAAEDWLRRLPQPAPPVRDQWYEAYLSPPALGGADPAASTLPGVPLRDQAVVAAADHLLLLHLRSGGHLHCLVQRRLASPSRSRRSVRLALAGRLVNRPIAGPLLARGAQGWIVAPKPQSNPAGAKRGHRTGRPAARRPSVRSALPGRLRCTDLLTHCTRRPREAWPDQTEDQFVDEMLLSPLAVKPRTACSALERIVSQRRITACSQGIRGKTPVVSFTAVPPQQLPKLRVFRPHRGRWDFEPYGIAIARDWLVGKGAGPVRYGDEQLWESLLPAERPFFQPRFSRPRKGGRRIDWSVECEWRAVGDVDLAHLPPQAATLFVPTPAEALALAPLSPWPIIVLAP